MSHTPGPWGIDPSDNPLYCYVRGPRCLGQVATVHHVGSAPLIAAAPELLEACKAVLDAINHADLDGVVLWIEPPYQAAGVHESATDRLTTVIAKAEGK